MAFGVLGNAGAQQPVAEINMIPLIDVMLVLLVIFIIAAPLMTHAVNVELPKASSHPEVDKPEVVHLSVDKAGQVYWNNQVVDGATLRSQMKEAAGQANQPELRIRADGQVAYHHVAMLMAHAARVGLSKIGFVTEPAADPQ